MIIWIGFACELLIIGMVQHWVCNNYDAGAKKVLVWFGACYVHIWPGSAYYLQYSGCEYFDI